MKHVFLFFAVFLSSIALLGMNHQKDDVKWDFHSASGSSILHFELEDYKLDSEVISGQKFDKIHFENYGHTIEEGLPLLPTYSQTIAIPEKGSISYQIISSEREEISNINMMPYQTGESRQANEFVINEDFYRSGSIYPAEIINVSQPAIMRNLRLITVTVNPFQFDPVNNRLFAHKDIEIEISFSEEKGINEIEKSLPQSRFFTQFFEATVLNYSSLRLEQNFQQPAYLFIYPNDTQVENLLQPLLDWKRRIGYDVQAFSTAVTGTTTSSIKSFIQNAYDNWENPPEFICLVGDAGGSFNIPTSNYGGGEGDHYYTLLDGNDILADAFIGRLSFNTTLELQTIVSKILNYERQPFMGDTNWFNKALLVGDPSISGQSCIITNKNIKEMMAISAPNMQAIEVYSGAFASQMSNHINSGVSFFNYRGWLNMSGFGNSNVDNLNNGFMLPVVVTITCATGNFSGTSDAIIERFLKAGTPNNPKGAIAAIGTATSSTHTTFNNCVNAGIFYGLFIDGITHIGGALNRGKYNLYHNFPNNPNNAVEKFSYWNNLMGDPGMSVWTKTPEQFSVDYQTSVNEGSGYYQVFVNDSNGFAVKDAWVTILKGDNELFATDFTDELGQVLLPISSNASGNVDLTITKQNYLPYLSEFSIESGTSAFLDDYTIFDGNSSDSSGNSNGQLNPGETIELSIDVKNFGDELLSDVSATLASTSPYITIIEPDTFLGNIASNNTADGVFLFSVTNDIYGSVDTYFQIYIEDGSGNEWLSHLILPIFAPEVKSIDHTIFDGNNEIWDPGETVEFTITLQNNGAIAIENVHAEITTNHSGITLLDSMAVYGDIPPEGTAVNSFSRFSAFADSQVIPGTQIPLQLIITNSTGFEQTIYYSIPIGTVAITDPLGPDAYGYYAYDCGDTSYELAPTYDWVEIDPNYGGPGTVISMNDNGHTGDLQIFDLPFPFQFYGVTYNQITVCSNGFLSPGITEQYSYMNWSIPGPLGPSPMIAPFWDNLKMASGRVCYYHDEAENRFIVQWSRIQNNFSSHEQTFQAILYDAAVYPTLTGDGDILFQYNVVNNTSHGSYSSPVRHGQYATVGLEDHTSTVGLEYTYDNAYPTAAKTLHNGMAILFTTNGGQILNPPIVNIQPDSFQIALLQHGSENHVMQISNMGEANLTYSISKNYLESREIDRDSGGPDEYGYQWFDNNEPNGPTYSWREISDIGTLVDFSHNDVGTDMIPLEFEFPFYGTAYDEFLINPNGWIGFGEDNTLWLNTPIPNIDAPRPAIMPFWDDLDPDAGGEVYYYSTPDSLIVQFEEVWHYVGTYNGIYTFEVILYPDGRMLFQYKSVSGATNVATIGIQNEDASDGLQIVYNSNYVHNELAIEIKRVVEWVNISSASGIIASGNSANVGLTIESSDLEIGEYACELIITTNDPNHSYIIVPVHLQVVDSISTIEVDVAEFIWGDIALNETIFDTLTVTNTGQDPLLVSNIISDLAGCSADPQSFTLQPNHNKEIVITFQPQEAGDFEAFLTIFSNDPLQGELPIPISVSVTETSGDVVELALETKLLGNYPNPFNPNTQIKFTLQQEENITLDIFNIKGKKVRTLANGIYSAGTHQISWNGSDDRNRRVGSGIYLYRLQTKKYESIQKMILLK